MSQTHRLRTIVFAIVTGATSLGPALPTSMAPLPIVEAGVETPMIIIDAATPEQEAMVEWTLTRFAEAGLALPALTITFHTTIEGCRGFAGHYSRAAKQLDICNQGGGRTQPVHTVLHELAHAWSFEVLSASDQAQWSAHRGLDAWHDESAAWWKQGREQAAEVVAWGLMSDADPFINTWVIGEHCDDLAASFRLLTGTDPLNTAEHSCR